MHNTFGKFILSSPLPPRVIRVLTGILFVYAAVPKLIDPQAFARIITAYDLVPVPLLPLVAIGLPLLELLAGFGLIFDVAGSLTIVTLLLLLFVAVLHFGIVQNLDIDCGCFSPQEQAEHEGLKTAYYRDLALLAAMTYLHARNYYHRHNSAPPPAGGPKPKGDHT